MFLLNNMDINQEGQLSSEDRLFSSGTPRYQSPQSQVGVTVSGCRVFVIISIEGKSFRGRAMGGRQTNLLGSGETDSSSIDLNLSFYDVLT